MRSALRLLPFAILFSILFRVDVHPAQAQSFETFKARNRVSMEYAVLLPDDYDSSKEYPAVIAFEDGKTTRDDASELVEWLWSRPSHRAGWIVVVPLTPGNDWRTHPNHHALNDLMDDVSSEYAVHGDRYHILGVGSEGVDIAGTWFAASPDYFEGLIAIEGAPFQRWDDNDLGGFLRGKGADMEIFLVAPEDGTLSDDQRTAVSRFAFFDKETTVLRIPEADLGTGGLLEAVTRAGSGGH